MSCISFSFSDVSSCQLCVGGFVCLPAVAYCGCKNEGPLCWEPRAVKFSPYKAWSRSKPGVGQNIAMHASPTARKVSIVLSDICLPSPFTMFSKIVSPYLFFKCRKISGQWQIMKSRLQTWSKHCRLIACASAFYSQLVWLWVTKKIKNPELFYF